MDLKDKVIVVTGGGQGLGACICHSLSAAGAVSIPVDIALNKVERLVKEIKTAGNRSHGFLMDVSDEKNVDHVLKQVIKEYGKIDAVINNAGVDVTKSVEELSFEEWDKVIDVNLKGPFVVSKLAFQYLSQNGGGHIVNIASTAAKRTWANASAYHASKWGLLGLSHALHVEARKKNIKVTALIAGGMQTPFILERFPDVDPGLLQDPKNVADTVKYILCQPKETVIPEIMVIPMTETSWP